MSRKFLAGLVLSVAASLTLCSVVALSGNETAKPDLIGGTPADPTDWPASVYSRQGNSRCSATVIGKQVLLIAAHCVGNGGTAQFEVLSNSYSARCSHHPEYRGNSTADWALCKISNPVAGVPYEVVNTDPNLYSRGDTLRLTGYGCIRPGGGGGNDGIYRIGEAQVTSTPSGRDYDTVTRGNAALCYGDSGGPAFYESDDGKRVLVGVNSRGNIRNTSYLSSVHVNTALDWARSWSSSNDVAICGVHENAEGCRYAEEEEEEEEEEELDCSTEFSDYDSAKQMADGKFAILKACLAK